MPEDSSNREVGNASKVNRALRGDVESNCARRNERTAMSSARRYINIIFVSAQRLGTG